MSGGATAQLDGKAASSTPEATLALVTAALGRGDVIGAGACFCRDACLITPDATMVSGREAIRAILTQVVTMRLRARADPGRAIVAGDVALGRWRWCGTSVQPDGTSYEQNWLSTVVLKRVGEDWKLQIVAPWEFDARDDRRTER